MNILFLKRYNNYANRIIKRDKVYIEDFVNAVGENKDFEDSFNLENINFNPNDEVDTTLIVGNTPSQTWPEWTPDYCLVYDPADAIHQEQLDQTFTPVKSSWFVTHADRTRQNQYSLTLRRDVIKDNYDSIAEAEVFIEKATLPDDNNLIFNPEGQKFNQIKKGEDLLKDPTGMQWLVGYVVQDGQEHGDLTATYSVLPAAGAISLASVPNAVKNLIDFQTGEKESDVLDYYDSSVAWSIQCTAMKYIWTLFIRSDNYGRLDFTLNQNGSWNWNVNFPAATTAGDDIRQYESALTYSGEPFMVYDPNSWEQSNWTAMNSLASWFNQTTNRSYIMSQFRSEKNLKSYSNYISLMNYNGKTLYDSTTGKYYKLRVETEESYPIEATYQYNSTSSSVKYRVQSGFQTYNGQGYSYNSSTTSANKYFTLRTKAFKIKVYADTTVASVVKWKLPEGRNPIISQPYDMFCIPYGSLQCSTFTTSQAAGLAACRALAKSGIGQTNALVYDIQLLPYCPLQSTITSNSIDERVLREHRDFEYINDEDGNHKSIAFFCLNSEFSFNIPIEKRVQDVKLESECDFYRLVSPNYSGVFEFNLAKNNGLSYVNVDCSYKPYNPYIHLNPDFDKLYGSDYDDSRGLICTGDFSLAMCTNAWEQYKLQNKNFQEMFDRGIQKMDETAQINTDVAVANQIGKLAGNLGNFNIGGLLNQSVTASVPITEIKEKNRIEKSYATDMFNFQNGNIKALPNSLAKTDPFTYNNKKWPFLEYYTCTDEEKEAFRQKLKYNGMTVNKIDKIPNYLIPTEKRFIQGQLIRDEYVINDSHMVDAIYSELKKGVYL